MIYYSFFNYKINWEKTHEKNYIHHGLHSLIRDLRLCQQKSKEKDDPSEIFGVIFHLKFYQENHIQKRMILNNTGSNNHHPPVTIVKNRQSLLVMIIHIKVLV